MQEIDGRIAWAPRVSRKKIRQLYRSEAQGIVDERLIDEVAYAFLDRCRDMLIATRAHGGAATCPICSSEIRHAWDKAVLLKCSCGWSMTWGDYLSSYQGRQLHLGGAAPWVQEYVDGFRAANTAGKKMVLIDRLLHQFHWGLKHPGRKEGPKGPTRPLAVNFIGGNMRSVLAFLDELSELGEPADPIRAATRDQYRENREAARAIWRPHTEGR
jgi:hypothetical protein